jgi:hypothetical protein
MFWFSIPYSPILVVSDSNRGKIEDLNIQREFKHEKGMQDTKGPRQKNSSQKDEVEKTEWSGFGFQRVWFSQNRYSPIRI